MSEQAVSNRHALVVGSTGISGRALCHELLAHGWQVTGVSRRSPVDIPESRLFWSISPTPRPSSLHLVRWRRPPCSSACGCGCLRRPRTSV
jgi:hypothetical protein